MSEWKPYVDGLAIAARRASRTLASVDGAAKVHALLKIAGALRRDRALILQANAVDLENAARAELAGPLIERLKLSEKKIEAMAAGVEQIAAQVDPVGRVLDGYVRPNGLRIEKRRVPLGVILFFYESRPNVTCDAAALCIKSGNAVILRGGKESLNSNRAIAGVIAEAIGSAGLDPASVQLIESADRSLVPYLLKLEKYIDLVIPRGGESLIRAVVADSTIPVLKHFTGNCHLYIDAATETMEQEVRDICVNSKTSYPGGAVCNAVEHLLFHRNAAERLLPAVCQDLVAMGVEVRGDPATCRAFAAAKPAVADDWATEYLSFTVSIKVVDSMEEAIIHINEFGSHHTDGILSTNVAAIDDFVKQVDSASVMINASTRFADGGEYGLGAEIGISTDKMHARGPMGADDLCTYKWVVTGRGHVRE